MRMTRTTTVQGLVVMATALLLLTNMADCTLGKGDRGKKEKKANSVLQEVRTLKETVIERGLPREKITYKEIVKEHASFSFTTQEVKNFEGASLAYITPWHNKGYDNAKVFGRKFTHISPVWLQIHRKPGGAFVMEGLQDIDQKWMEEVKAGRNVEIVPRVLFDSWTIKDYSALFSSEDTMEDCIDVIMKTCKKYNFDGFVIEIWSQLQGQKRRELMHFIPHMAEAFRRELKTFILVLPPSTQTQEFEELALHVDYFSIMTYDFTVHGYMGGQGAGPNAPVRWLQHIVTTMDPGSQYREKILLGLNFYGIHFPPNKAPEPILGPTYIQLLKKHSPDIKWEPGYGEHRTTYLSDGQHIIYYPSLKSIQMRLALAAQLGTGVAVWELGQGLDYFLDLF